MRLVIALLLASLCALPLTACGPKSGGASGGHYDQ